MSAYEFGKALGNIQRARIEFAKQLVAGFQAAMRPTTTLDPEERSEAIYRQRIEREHKLGRLYVKTRATAIRRELGLDA